MKIKLTVLIMLISLFVSVLSGCAKEASPVSTDAIETTRITETAGPEQQDTPESAEPSASPAPGTDTGDPAEKKAEIENTVYTVSSVEEITAILVENITYFPSVLNFDVTALEEQGDVISDDMMNGYNGLTSYYPDLKYMYDYTPSYTEGAGTATCTMKYMPFMTGEIDTMTLPDGTVDIYSLKDLKTVANNGMGEESMPIAIRNQELTVDDMSNALHQAGYGYILYQLGEDGMSIYATPDDGMTMQEAVEEIEMLKEKAAEIAASVVTPDMTDDEKIQALYRYIIDNVVYDPLEVTNVGLYPKTDSTAYGSLILNLAICSGYSWGVNMLCEAEGIECYNVEGYWGGVGHMWNYMEYNGEYLYFDATSDRGQGEYPGAFAVTAEICAFSHEFDDDFYQRLVQ